MKSKTETARDHDEGDADQGQIAATGRVRLDKWLWAARFYKTRALASDDVAKGRIDVNGQAAKASRELHIGDRLDLRHGPLLRTVVVERLTPQRGSATVAQTMYAETPESVERRERWQRERRERPEPAQAIEHGRPTKRDRRQIADWNRWSASVDPD